MRGCNSRDPVAVHASEGCASILTLLRLERTDKDAIRREEIRDSSSLGQKLGVGEDIEAASGLGVGIENGAHGFCRAAGYRGLLDNDL